MHLPLISVDKISVCFIGNILTPMSSTFKNFTPTKWMKKGLLRRAVTMTHILMHFCIFFSEVKFFKRRQWTCVVYILLIVHVHRIQSSNVKAVIFLFLSVALTQFVLTSMRSEELLSKLRRQFLRLDNHFQSQIFNCGYGNLLWHWLVPRMQNSPKEAFTVGRKLRPDLPWKYWSGQSYTVLRMLKVDITC